MQTSTRSGISAPYGRLPFGRDARGTACAGTSSRRTRSARCPDSPSPGYPEAVSMVALRWVAAAMNAANATATAASHTTMLGLDGSSPRRRPRRAWRTADRGTGPPRSSERASTARPGRPARARRSRSAGCGTAASASVSTAPGSWCTPAIAFGWISLPRSVSWARRPGISVSATACRVASARLTAASAGCGGAGCGRRPAAPTAPARRGTARSRASGCRGGQQPGDLRTVEFHGRALRGTRL